MQSFQHEVITPELHPTVIMGTSQPLFFRPSANPQSSHDKLIDLAGSPRGPSIRIFLDSDLVLCAGAASAASSVAGCGVSSPQ